MKPRNPSPNASSRTPMTPLAPRFVPPGEGGAGPGAENIAPASSRISPAEPLRREPPPGASPAPQRRGAARITSVVVGVAAVLSSIACVDFDLEEQIEDTRILAVKTEPAEILFSPLYLSPPDQRPPFPLPSTDVDVEVFAFDPRGGRVRTSIAMCPEDADDASCRLYDKSFDEDFARLSGPARDEVETLLTPRVFDEDIAEDATPVGRTSPSRFTFTITPAAIDFFQPKNENGENVPSIFPLLPRFSVLVENLTAQKEGEEVFRERGFKRLPLTLDLADPSLPRDFLDDLARGIGVTLCDSAIPDDDSFVEGRADCLHPRTANLNPALVGFRLESVDVEDDLTEGMLFGDDPDLGLGSLIRADPGATVAVTPMWRDGAVERYQVLSFDIEASVIVVENRVEDMACTWYATRGTLSSPLTALQFNDERLGQIWTLPSDARSGERDSLVLVALDQRGGSEVAEITVEYR